MPGRIYKRGRSYVLKVYAGREGGKKRDKWLTFPTHQAAETVQRELASHTLAHSAGTGIYGSPRERLGPYLVDWLSRQKPHLAPKTHERYETFVGQIRKDVIGTVPLARLTPRALENYYARKVEAGLSSTTVNHQHRMIHKALGDAERQDLILKNPAHLAVAPKRAKTRPEVWTEAQTFLLLSEAKASSTYYPLYFFLVCTGVRLGEALGLRWRDLNLDKAEADATIVRTLQRCKGGGYLLKQPKTHRSSRVVTLPAEVVDELRALKAREVENRSRRVPCERGQQCARPVCPRWHEFGLVFSQPNGLPLHANNLRQRDLHPLAVRLGLPWRRALHNLRHAHGSYLLQRGVSVKVVQERLGHSSPAFTLATYTHVLAGMQAQAVRAVSDMIQDAKRVAGG